MVSSCATSFRYHFVFEGYGDHRDLHSFPTRRSSDLPPPATAPATRPSNGSPPRTSMGAPSSIARWRRLCRIRSEEHSSELQSRRDLVCRLMLEKKNIE